MLLAVDIGNTSTKFGVFDGEELVSRFDVPTDSDDLVADIDGRLEANFDSAVVSSVVPEAGERLERLITHGYNVEPLFVTTDLDVGLIVKHEPLDTLGIDRFVNSFAASKKYGTPVIVCSFGTATTIDMVNKKRELVGGLIAPGMQLMAKALNENTARLPEVDVRKPKELLAISTEDAIRSGVYLSLVGLVETAIGRIKTTSAKVVATGGFAAMIAESCSVIDTVDENLTLDGLRLIAGKIKAR